MNKGLDKINAWFNKVDGWIEQNRKIWNKGLFFVLLATILAGIFLLTANKDSEILLRPAEIKLKSGEIIDCPAGISPTNTFVDFFQETLSCYQSKENKEQVYLIEKMEKSRWIKWKDISEIRFKEFQEEKEIEKSSDTVKKDYERTEAYTIEKRGEKYFARQIPLEELVPGDRAVIIYKTLPNGEKVALRIIVFKDPTLFDYFTLLEKLRN